MYKIFDAPEDPFAVVQILAIMPMQTMKEVLSLQKEAVQRIERETANGGVCQLFFRNPIPGFGKKVIVQAA
jgi:hypothetical protein